MHQIRQFELLFDAALQAEHPSQIVEGACLLLQRFRMSSSIFLVRADQKSGVEHVLFDDFDGLLSGMWQAKPGGSLPPLVEYAEQCGALAELESDHLAQLGLNGLGLSNSLIVSYSYKDQTKYYMVFTPPAQRQYDYLSKLSIGPIAQKLCDAVERSSKVDRLQSLLSPREAELALLMSEPGIRLKQASLILGETEEKGSNIMAGIRRKLKRAGHAIFNTRDAAQFVASHTPERERRRVLSALSGI